MPWSKRLFDLVTAGLACIILSPVMLALAILVRLIDGSPVLFRQLRPGYKGRPFYIYKLRTMLGAPDANGNPRPDSARLTRLGLFMRSFSLDELPELINVLRGDMSVVGPRPLMMEYLPLYSANQMRRHDAYPGLTGWAQVNGRNALDWPARFALDIWYVDHWSFWLDLKIICLTVWKVISRQGISQPGHATMEYFKGNQD